MVIYAGKNFGVRSPEAKEARDTPDRVVCDVLGISREEFDRLMASWEPMLTREETSEIVKRILGESEDQLADAPKGSSGSTSATI